MKVGVSTSSFGNPDDRPIRFLKDLGLEVALNPHGRRLSRDEAILFVRDLDGLLAGLEPLDRGVLEAASKLRAIGRVGIGMDNVDVAAAEELGILVSNTPDPPTAAVAEMTLAAMLTLVRGFSRDTSAMRDARWEKCVSASLQGATVLLVGYGRIGRRVRELVRAFEATVLVTDPALSQKDIGDDVRIVPLEAGLPVADVVSLHAGGSACVLGEAQLLQMKRGAVLLNSARGALVDESGLRAALERGHLAGAWFDAFWEEPYSGPLLAIPTFFGTPHVATYTAACRSQMEMEAAQNVAAVLGANA